MDALTIFDTAGSIVEPMSDRSGVTKQIAVNRIIGSIAAVPALAFVLAGCKPENKFQPPPPAEINVGVPVKQEVAPFELLTGNTVAFATVDLVARVEGFLTSQNYVDGSEAKKGQQLFGIEQTMYKAKVKEAEAQLDGAKATLEFLLRRMRFKSDFPALSNAVVRIQRLVGSDTESLGSLSNEILKDVALTNKLLRMVNSVHFNRSGGGTISTVSRAVALVGFAGIRNMALSLVLLEHMQDKQHASRLRDEFVRALMAGQLASELTPWNTDVEDAYLAALMQNLGRLLTEFYLPDEARAIRDQLVQAQPGRAMPTPHDIELASERVLGLGFEELGLGVAKSWALPDDLQHAMRRHPGAPPAKAAERGIERQLQRGHDLRHRARAVTALEDLPRALVELDHALGVEQHMGVLHRLPLQPEAGRDRRPPRERCGRVVHRQGGRRCTAHGLTP